MSDQTPPIQTPDQIRAIQALRVIVADDDPVIFRARHDHPNHQYYSATIHYLVANISVLVSNAIGEPLHQGRFRISIVEIMERLAALGVTLSNWRIVEVDDANPIETDDKNP